MLYQQLLRDPSAQLVHLGRLLGPLLNGHVPWHPRRRPRKPGFLFRHRGAIGGEERQWRECLPGALSGKGRWRGEADRRGLVGRRENRWEVNRRRSGRLLALARLALRYADQVFLHLLHRPPVPAVRVTRPGRRRRWCRRRVLESTGNTSPGWLSVAGFSALQTKAIWLRRGYGWGQGIGVWCKRRISRTLTPHAVGRRSRECGFCLFLLPSTTLVQLLL